MKNFKVGCKIEGQEDYTLFVKAIDEADAETKAKRYMISERPELDYICVNTVKEV